MNVNLRSVLINCLKNFRVLTNERCFAVILIAPNCGLKYIASRAYSQYQADMGTLMRPFLTLICPHPPVVR